VGLVAELPLKPLKPLRLLIVEDSEDDVMALCSELDHKRVGLTYRRVDSASTMRGALLQDEWDVVISDHSLPSFSSTEALKILRQTGKDIPFIIYSGTITDQFAEVALREGAQDCIRKGAVGRLLPSIERELRNANLRREKQQVESHIYRLAYYDALTELPNRNLFFERMDELLHARHTRSAALFLVDIHGFIRINNTFGYSVGDSVIRMLGKRLSTALHDVDIVARFGGDDFAVVQSGIDSQADAIRMAKRIAAVLDEPFHHEELEFVLNPAIGVSLHPADGGDALALVRNAELALSTAKRSVDRRCVFYEHSLSELSAQRLNMEMGLRHAVARNELRLHYQPIACLGTGALLGYEALVRWQHPELGLLGPDRFVPVADETGLVVGIGEWVLREACRQTMVWRDAGHNVSVSVNVSAVQFAQPQLISQVADVLRDTGLDPACLELEVTESVLMRDVESTIATLYELKKMGIRISLDDFGTGYSSLSYIKRFPIDVIKIDKAFTRDMTASRDSAAIVSAVVALAKGLELVTQAEGVETAEQLGFLHQKGCDRMQGYVLSRPVPAEEAQLFLTDGGARCRQLLQLI